MRADITKIADINIPSRESARSRRQNRAALTSNCTTIHK